MSDYNLFIVGLILLLILIVIIVLYYINIDSNKVITTDPIKRSMCFVINLDKNTDRLNNFLKLYFNSDVKNKYIERLSGINGKQIDIEPYTTKKAYDQIKFSEEQGYRLKHYELTRGACGCYLSHLVLYQKLLQDTENDFYIIFEDDAVITPHFYNKAKKLMLHPPYNWDLITFGALREEISEMGLVFQKYKMFWGLFGYIINKKGAKKMIDEYNARKIDKQIDSVMNLMILEHRFNAYGIRNKIVWHDIGVETDIQLPIKSVKDVDPDQLLEQFREDFPKS